MCVGNTYARLFDPFETSVRAVLGQQITVKAVNTLAGRIVQSFGRPVQTQVDGLTHIFGSWTAQYIAMRIMAWPDAFLEMDVVIKKALPG